MNLRVAPSILAADFGRLAEQVREAEEGGADWIHVDVMDGHFVPNLTLGPPVVAAVRRATDLPLDVHLMIEAPERSLAAFADAGANVITVHQEVCPHLHRTLEQIRECGASPGVALNPATPVSTLEAVVQHIDLLLVMSVNPGFGGQRYIPTSTGKIARARDLLARAERSDVAIEVDGGVDVDTAPLVVGAGASVLVAGSAVYRSADGIEAAITALRTAALRGADGSGPR